MSASENNHARRAAIHTAAANTVERRRDASTAPKRDQCSKWRTTTRTTYRVPSDAPRRSAPRLPRAWRRSPRAAARRTPVRPRAGAGGPPPGPRAPGSPITGPSGGSRPSPLRPPRTTWTRVTVTANPSWRSRTRHLTCRRTSGGRVPCAGAPLSTRGSRPRSWTCPTPAEVAGAPTPRRRTRTLTDWDRSVLHQKVKGYMEVSKFTTTN